ncbi:MAG TPA: prolyl oligopeptidase family serine peptidase [Terriglobales bacterium]|nr:prolyl oligopeptidase family serine peptidase [Terriglobales bacterium]
MKALRLSFFVLCIAIIVSVATAQNQAAQKAPAGPPVARQDNVQQTLHGVTISDPYRWLEDQNSPETRAWINAENAYTHKLLDAWPGRSRVQQRATELLRIDSIRMPIERSERYFYRKRAADQDLYLIYMRERQRGKEELLIDPLPMSPDHSTNVEVMDVSKDGKVMAYGVRQGGADEQEIRLFDVDARHDMADKLPPAVYFEVSFLPDRNGFYYSMMSGDGPRVRFHKVGTDVSADPEIFGKGYAKDKIIVADASEDGRHLVVLVSYGSTGDKTEIWAQDLEKHGALQMITKGIDARFFAYAAGDEVILHTNWKAPNGRVMAAKFDDPAPDHWREIVPESDVAIDGITPAGGKVLVSYVRNASSEVKLFTATGNLAAQVKFPTLVAVEGMSGRWEGRDAFIEFSSFATAKTIYRYNTSNGTQSTWAQVRAPVQSDAFEVRQEWFASKDGTKVPMFLVFKKGFQPDGSAPALLTGYGGFNVNITPSYSADTIMFAERGGVVAQVNLRGGGEFGEAWHRAGMMEKKQNVFDDFLAAAEWLIQNHYTSTSRLSILGGSNGGLLVGAAMTQRPDLFQAVVCWHPLLDMLRYQNFMEAQFWVSEYGSADNAEQFKYLYAYSPYQHVKKGTKYPAVLFMTGDADTRVAPLHARKMAALMQADTGSDRPILLRYELKAGHSAGRSVTAQIGDLTDQLSFLFWQLGVSP